MKDRGIMNWLVWDITTDRQISDQLYLLVSWMR